MRLARDLLHLAMGLALSILTGTVSGQDGWPAPETIKGTIPNNPIAQTLDPALIRRASDKKLFMYTTAKNGSVWTADSLYGPWKHEGTAKLREYGGAPSIHQVGDTYYLYINNHEFDYSTVGVTDPAIHQWNHNSSILAASSKTLEIGSWTQHGRLNIDWAKKYNILDAALLTIDDGGKRQNLLSFGSYQQGIFQLPLADPPTKIADGANGDIKQLANNQTKAFGTGPTEASYIFKWKEWYYMFFSSGRCCKQPDGSWVDRGDVYKVMVCRSKQPRSGYVDDKGVDCAKKSGGKEILGSHNNIWAPGGQGVLVDDEAGGPIIYYHYVPYDVKTKTPANEFRFGWNKLDFSSGWPKVVR
ncbi:glycoside hydrolase family 43 protein [Annulohypoxylon maeteangense]|uniref:glycoside hydrolase family 43 protein n=1 Tax=Annulohypoxylon maeteangense TaxID=1927788 RepID=UPI00200736C2|nr:glycoside hydrolase family 43 protein [Annulohypoxylon maeteangense]KAI0880843.1 glycoside hydrolase family 43 protein [Annulohypoxylon maeteangense]